MAFDILVMEHGALVILFLLDWLISEDNWGGGHYLFCGITCSVAFMHLAPLTHILLNEQHESTERDHLGIWRVSTHRQITAGMYFTNN